MVLVLLLAMPLYLSAQPGPPAGGTPPCGPPFGAACPIDGGVSLDNAKQIVDAGADVLVAGNAVFKSANPKQTIHQLKSI